MQALQGKEFRGGDVAATTKLSDGRLIVVFGDTLRSSSFPGPHSVRNSMFVLDGRCARLVLGPGRGATVPNRADGVGYWPMSVSDRAEGIGDNRLGVMMQRVRDVPGHSGLGFENLGPALAVFNVPAGESPKLVGVQDIGPDASDPARPCWGASTYVSPDGWAYLYGTANPGNGSAFGFSLSVARAKVGQVSNLATWTYWDGTRWSANQLDAKQVIPAAGGVSQTLSVIEFGGTYYAISKQDEFLGHNLAVWSSPTPWGPFSPPVVVDQIPSFQTPGELSYMVLAHPDVLPSEDGVVVSISKNNTDVATVFRDPSLYKPEFRFVHLPPLPSSPVVA